MTPEGSKLVTLLLEAGGIDEVKVTPALLEGQDVARIALVAGGVRPEYVKSILRVHGILWEKGAEAPPNNFPWLRCFGSVTGLNPATGGLKEARLEFIDENAEPQ